MIYLLYRLFYRNYVKYLIYRFMSLSEDFTSVESKWWYKPFTRLLISIKKKWALALVNTCLQKHSDHLTFTCWLGIFTLPADSACLFYLLTRHVYFTCWFGALTCWVSTDSALYNSQHVLLFPEHLSFARLETFKFRSNVYLQQLLGLNLPP